MQRERDAIKFNNVERKKFKPEGDNDMGKTIITKTENFTRKMAINIGTSIALQDKAGQKITDIAAAAVVTDIDRETGEEKQVAILVDGGGMSYSAISATVLQQMDDIIELIDDGEDFDVIVVSRKSKGGRDFITLNVV